MAYDEGRVKDLVEKLKKGEITPKEAKEGMKERGLSEQETWEQWILFFIVLVTYFSLCLLPTIVRTNKLESLEFFAQPQVIYLPTIVIYASIILLAIATFFGVWMNYLHRKKGGLKETGETIIFYIEGPYHIMRHPGGFFFDDVVYFAIHYP